MTKLKSKAIVAFSGGLDSRLVVKILKLQLKSENITIAYFLLPFGSKYPDPNKAKEFAKQEGVKFKLFDCTKDELLQEYLEIIKKPRYGHGCALNPCIDCKIFILTKIREYAEKNNIPIITTGEVLHQRPMSQHKNSLKAIENKSGLKGELLRPLSAKLLLETKAEKEKLIDREKLYDIQGRHRKPQIDLAKKFKIDYPLPAGGCLLCEKGFCEKLKPVLDRKHISELDIKLLFIRRHFDNGKIILGRNEKENNLLQTIQKNYNQGILIIPQEPGPTAFIQNKKYLEEAKEYIRKYSKQQTKGFEIKEI